MDIEIFGGGERVRTAQRWLSDADLKSLDRIGNIKILPIPSTRDGERITGTEIRLSDFLLGLSYDSFVIGYGLPQNMKEELEKRHVKFYDGAYDEEFLEENAYITAVGALEYVMQTSKRIPSDMSFGIVGYGRIGSALVRLLLFLGARVRIFSSKPLTRIELGNFGVDSSEIKLTGPELCELSELDVILNTAPTDLSGAFPEKCIPHRMRIIDLASGDSFPGVAGVEYLPSLPDRMYPESAGRVYAERAYIAMMAE